MRARTGKMGVTVVLLSLRALTLTRERAIIAIIHEEEVIACFFGIRLI